MGGRHSRNKGAGYEREIVKTIQQAGIHAERVPLSGGAGGEHIGDVKAHIQSRPWNVELKIRKTGFKQDYTWLEGHDALVKRADGKQSLITLPFDSFLSLAAHADKSKPDIRTLDTPKIDVPYKTLVLHTEYRGRSVRMTDVTSLPVREMADDNSALVIWCTPKMIPVYLSVMDHWGFSYQGIQFIALNDTDSKPSANGSNVVTSRSDMRIALIGTCGKVVRRVRAPHNVIASRNSFGITSSYSIIEAIYPGPYVEFFSPGGWPGWITMAPEAGRLKINKKNQKQDALL